MSDVPVEHEQPEVQPISDEKSLKYLDFVNLATIQLLLVFSKIYDLAKENSGPLKPGVNSVENTVKTVVGPVYVKYHDVPYELLKFFDRKVGDSVSELDRHVPAAMKSASNQACAVAQKTPEMARSVANEVQRAGVVGTATSLAKVAVTKCEPSAKEFYSKYEPVAEQYAVSGWRKLNKFPLFSKAAQVVLPTAAYCSEKYNGAVFVGREKGYAVAGYLMPVPTKKIAQVFGDNQNVVAAQ